VQVKGNTNMQTPPITWYNPKNATTDIKNRTQYKPLDFFVLSIYKNLVSKYNKIICPTRASEIFFLLIVLV
jgi:hypothetical protein